MPSPVPILDSARRLFAASANHTVMIENAWKPFGDQTEPGPGSWNAGWTPVRRPATRAVLDDLTRQGFTHVNVTAGARHRKDVRITLLT